VTVRGRWSPDGLLRWSHIAALAVLVLGLLFLAAYCVAEALASGYSLVDAYWRGRLPWMGIAEGLIVGGATVTAVTGAVTVFWLGGSGLRALAIPAVVSVGLWWFTAVLMTSMRYAPCEVGTPCPAPTPDPWAWAYSAPQQALLFLIAPSMGLSLLTSLSRRRSRRPAPG
jgi:hypothetical protein